MKKYLPAVYLFALLASLPGKVGAQVELLWKDTYTSAAKRAEIEDVLISKDGYIYVTGFSVTSAANTSVVTIKYNAAGSRMWLKSFSYNGQGYGRSITEDNAGNIIVGGLSGNSNAVASLVVKYNPAGQVLWSDTIYRSPNSLGEPEVKTDADNNIYIVHHILKNSIDIIVQKYNKDGKRLWSKTYDGPQNKQERLTNIQMDDKNNLYVCGSANGTGDMTGFVLKYDSAGSLLWDYIYDPTYIYGYSQCTRMVLDKNGFLYVSLSKTETSSVVSLIKLTENGTLVWDSVFREGLRTPSDMIIDKNDNIFITGTFEGTSLSDPHDMLLLKYNTNGGLEWKAQYNNPDSTSDHSFWLTHDDSGYIYVSGARRIKQLGSLPAVVKYDQSGAFIWEAHHIDSSWSGSESRGIVTDGKGNVYSIFFSTPNPAYNVLKFGRPVPKITLQPVNKTVCPGTPALFRVTTKATQPAVIQWQIELSGVYTNIQDDTIFNGGQNDSLVIKAQNMHAGNTYKVRCIITDPFGADTSVVVQFKAHPRPNPAFTYTSNKQVFNFSASDSTVANAWNWTFSDGSDANIRKPVKNFSASQGTQVTVKLVVSTGQGCRDSSEQKIQVPTNTGVDILLPEGWAVYPNPVHDKLIIKSATGDEAALQITDANGRVVAERDNISAGYAEISVSDLKPGLYFVSLVINGKNYTSKVFKY